MKAFVWAIAMLIPLNSSISRAADAHIGAADLIAKLQLVKPHQRISGNLKSSLQALANEQKTVERGANTVGVSVDTKPRAIQINIHGANEKKITSNKTGLAVLNELKNVVFGQKIQLLDARYYLIGFPRDVSWLTNIRIVDSDGRQSQLSIPASANEKTIFSDPLKGPYVSLVFDDIPKAQVPRSWSYTDLLVLDWPTDANSVLPDTDVVLTGNSPPEPAPTPAPLRYKYALPSDFVDSACAFDSGLSYSFATDLKQYASAVGLIQNIRKTDSGTAFVNFCTGSLTSNASGQPMVVTSNSCINGKFGAGVLNTRAVSTKIVWDYRNSSCNFTSPTRWTPVQIAGLPSTQLAELLAIDVANDIVALRPDSAPAGRASLVIKGGSDPTEIFRFALHHSDLRPLQGSYLLRLAPADPTVAIPVTVPPPCSTRPGERFAYSLPFLDTMSSAIAGGGNGAPIFGLATTVIETMSDICRDIFQTNPADFSVNGRVDAIVAGMH